MRLRRCLGYAGRVLDQDDQGHRDLWPRRRHPARLDFGEWDQWLGAPAAAIETRTISRTEINTARGRRGITKQIADFVKQGVAPPHGAPTTTTRRPTLRRWPARYYSSDLLPPSCIEGKKPGVRLGRARRPARQRHSPVHFTTSTFRHEFKTPDKDLAWEVLKFWMSAASRARTGRACLDLSGAHRRVQIGYDKNSCAPARRLIHDHPGRCSIRPEPFANGMTRDPGERRAAPPYSGNTPEEGVTTSRRTVQERWSSAAGPRGRVRGHVARAGLMAPGSTVTGSPCDGGHRRRATWLEAQAPQRRGPGSA